MSFLVTNNTWPVKEVVRVIDGDTVDMRISLGFHVEMSLRFRLVRINAPEMKTIGGPLARDWALVWLNQASLRVISHKTDDYGRWLGDIIRADGHSLSDDLILAGHAVPWPAAKKETT